jgi:hypothetical protein
MTWCSVLQLFTVFIFVSMKQFCVPHYVISLDGRNSCGIATFAVLIDLLWFYLEDDLNMIF